jgi:hypothetical protein
LNFDAFDLVDERLGHRLLGLVVLRELIEDRPREHPHLVDLRRVLDEVARRHGREARVVDLRQEAVQRVAELVKQRLGVVEGDEHRLAGRALDEVVVVRRKRRHRLAGEGLAPW